MRPVSFENIVEGSIYNLDWYIDGIQQNYVVCVNKKNVESNTLYVEIASLPNMVWMVCYRHLVDAPPGGDHTWLKLKPVLASTLP
jgi:hypothetical protein